MIVQLAFGYIKEFMENYTTYGLSIEEACNQVAGMTTIAYKYGLINDDEEEILFDMYYSKLFLKSNLENH